MYINLRDITKISEKEFFKEAGTGRIAIECVNKEDGRKIAYTFYLTIDELYSKFIEKMLDDGVLDRGDGL